MTGEESGKSADAPHAMSENNQPDESRIDLTDPGAAPSDDFRHERWKEEPTPPWWKWIFTGWRLPLTLLLLGGMFWGAAWPSVEKRLREWRGLRALEQWQEARQRGETAAAAPLLDKARILAPEVPEVLRALVADGLPRRDERVLISLRKLVRAGVATEDEGLQLCRLANEWGQPQFVERPLMERWAESDAVTAGLQPFLMGCRWLMSRGWSGRAVQRLKVRLATTAQAEERPILMLTLATALLGARDVDNRPELLREAVGMLHGLVVPPADEVSAEVRRRAALALAGLLAADHDARTRLGYAALRAFREAAEAVLTLPVTDATVRDERVELALALTTLDLAMGDLPRADAPARVEGVMPDDSERWRRRTLAWLGANRFHAEVIAKTDGDEALKDRFRFLARCEALAGLERWADMETAMPEGQALPVAPVTAAALRWRTAVKLGKPDEVVEALRDAVDRAALTSDGPSQLEAALNMEKWGEPEVAVRLYRRLRDDEEMAVAARRGLVRCLEGFPLRTRELQDALESLLLMTPEDPEARRMADHLKLLGGAVTEAEADAIVKHATQRPDVLRWRATHALALLRSGRAEKALEAFAGVTLLWENVPPETRCVRAAAMAAAGRQDEAKQLAATIPGPALRPGEYALLRDHVPGIGIRKP